MYMRSALFWDVTHRRIALRYGHFGKTYWVLEDWTDRLSRNVGNKLPFYDNNGWSWPLKTGPTICPETPVAKYRSMLRKIPKKRKSLLRRKLINPLKPELNPICYLLALLGAHQFLHVSRIRVKLLTLRLLMSYIYIYIWSTHSWCF